MIHSSEENGRTIVQKRGECLSPMTFYEESFPRSILSHLLVIRIWMINDPNDNIQN